MELVQYILIKTGKKYMKENGKNKGKYVVRIKKIKKDRNS